LKLINKITTPKSFFRVNIGAGNNLFSDQNEYLESFQGNTPFIMTPSIEYNHKSGFGINATGYLYNQNNTTNFYQLTLSPTYSYKKGKVADIVASYTHYFEQDAYTSVASPVQDELYAGVLFKKPWLTPGLSSGYAWGSYREIVKIDTAVTLLGTRYNVHYIDSIYTRLQSFSISASVEHSFGFYNLLSVKDGMLITPRLLLSGGVNSYTISHTSGIQNFLAFTKLKLKRIRHFLSQENNSGKFELQSAGFDLDVNYTIGKFYLEPEAYMDYYLPETNDDRLTVIYNFNIGITF
ncbi:MAG TPA: hypothetical protein VHA52_06170, partial [Candidatus Babeliaceae bacterium]|nr:hypothetical protein [Candidatus Babeliaceae bacterium]